ERTALPAIARIGCRVLIGDLTLREALKADAKAGRIHHDEHRGEALLGLADQPALRAVVVHDAGGVAMDAHLLLERAAADRVPLAQRPVIVHQEFRDDEEGDTLDVVRGPRTLGEYEVNDVV